MQQTEFLSRIRNALKGDTGRNPRPQELFAPRAPGAAEARLRQISSRSAAGRRALIERLQAMAAPINLAVECVDDPAAAAAAIVDLVRSTPPEWDAHKQVAAWRHPVIDALKLEALLEPLGVPVVYPPLPGGSGAVRASERSAFRQGVAASYVGVTSADFCVADSATLVMKTRAGQSRSVSLVPSVHVAVIEARQVIADLGELYALLSADPRQRAEGLTNCLTFISGPSKTADIEAHMVHGAHGPREMHLLIVGH